MTDRVLVYFKDACKFYEESIREFEEGLRKATPIRLGTQLKRRGIP